MATQVDAKIQQYVSKARSTLYRLKAKLDYSVSSTELKTRRSFDISELGKAFSIAQDAAETTNQVVKEREVTVHTLDLSCRALLDQNPSIDAIVSVYEVIRDLNDQLEVDFSISASLNRSEVASGSKELDASLTAKMIETFWESTATNHPDYEDYQRRVREQKAAAKKKADAEKAREKQESQSGLNMIANLKKKHAEYVQQGENLKKEYNEALDKELKHVEELVKTSVNNGIKKLEDEIAEQQRTLASLGFFAFSQKKACKTKIQELTSEISYRKTPDYFKKQFWPYQNKADTAKTRYADTVAGYIRQAFTDKEYPNHEHKAQLKNMKSIEDMYWGRKAGDKLVAEEILDYLYGNENGLSEMDLINKCFDYVGSLSMLLSKLVSARQIVREYGDGTCRYYHHGLKRFNKITLPTLKPGFSLPWPTPKDPKEVLKWSEE